ncbi:putative transcriptional regulator, MarR family [Candidatus Terasakiella magnetica]|uniref:Putative transcriptional regulator, MarR family n=1 Tax=Candidatus Terasakiella magnetica TaxID=1867952 RepID=A0A1C3RIX5_9PROT|nr:MarR family transcriptional regulator [Candidatus Terasakiella magnetica]SCA57204.1 putative transcriptional regulator, MarR family [Candidatus Terasakiella magnetica]
MPEKTNIGPLNDLMTYHLRRAQVTSFNNFTDAMAETQVTPGQFGVLTLIASNEGMSQSAVARSLGVERSTMVAVIDGLENRGLVLRKPSPTDRRSNALVLSDEGKEVYARGLELAKKSDRVTTSALNDEEAVQLVTLLRKMNSAAGV